MPPATHTWTIGGVTVPNFFTTRTTRTIDSEYNGPMMERPCVQLLNPYLQTIDAVLVSKGIKPLTTCRQISYHYKRNRHPILTMLLFINEDESFAWYQYEGRVPGDRKFFILFGGKKIRLSHDTCGNRSCPECNWTYYLSSLLTA